MARGHWVPQWEAIGCVQVQGAASCWHYFAARFFSNYISMLYRRSELWAFLCAALSSSYIYVCTCTSETRAR